MKLEFNHNNTKIIVKDSTKQEFNQLKLHLNRLVEGYHFKKRLKLGVWDGVWDHFHNGNIHFGLWQEIYNCCKKYDFPFEIDKTKFPFDNTITYEQVETFCKEYFDGYRLTDKTENGQLIKGGEFTPYEHQMKAVFKLLKYKFGIVEVATAGGKSLICSIFIFYLLRFINPNMKILLIVPSITLVCQFYDDILDYNIGFNKEQQNPFDLNIVEIMSDKPRKNREDTEPNIFIGTYQSLEKYDDKFFKQFGAVITDEAHKSKAKTLDTILSRTFETALYRFGVSGTFPKETSAEYLSIQALMGPKLMTVKFKELNDKGLVSNMKIKTLVINYNDYSFAENVYNIKKFGKGKRAYDLEKEYCQKSDKRKLFLNKLVSKFNSNSLILFHNVEYGEALYNFFRDNIKDKEFYYIDGSISSEKREAIKKMMEVTSGNPKILVASYGTLSTGVSIRAIMNIVFADSFKSDQIIRQSIGRGLRLHKEKSKLHVFDIVDRFHKNFKNILYNHYLVRRDDIYKKQEMPFEELQFSI